MNDHNDTQPPTNPSRPHAPETAAAGPPAETTSSADGSRSPDDPASRPAAAPREGEGREPAAAPEAASPSPQPPAGESASSQAEPPAPTTHPPQREPAPEAPASQPPAQEPAAAGELASPTPEPAAAEAGADDAGGLQREIAEALGEMELDDLAALAAGSAPAGVVDGVMAGTVVAIQGEDIYVDLGGRSEGLLPASQFQDRPVPGVGETVQVTVQGQDEENGLLILSRKGAVLAASWDRLEVGQVVEGRVTGQNKGGLELSIDGLRAFMPVSQIEISRVEDMEPYVGRKLPCEVVEIDRARGNLIVSRRRVLEAERAQARAALWEKIEEGQIVAGVVRAVQPYGAFVDIGGEDGLLHVSDMSYAHVDNPKDVVRPGQQVQVKVLKVDRQKGRISLGLKQTMQDPWDGVEAKYPVDHIVTGTVTRLADFGAFVQLEEGVDGLVPISELTFERRVGHPREVVQAGQQVNVRVLKIEPARHRISLSLKRVGADPWQGASVRWPAESFVEGMVTRVVDFGAFVQLAPGVDGLIHISELTEGHVQDVGSVVRPGQEVRVKVLQVDEDRRRISLSLRQGQQEAPPSDRPEAAPPSAPEATYDADSPPPDRRTRRRRRDLKGGLD